MTLTLNSHGEQFTKCAAKIKADIDKGVWTKGQAKELKHTTTL